MGRFTCVMLLCVLSGGGPAAGASSGAGLADPVIIPGSRLELFQGKAIALLRVFAVGGDGLRAIPIPEFRRNLAEMIQLARAAGAKVLLAGIHIPPNYGPAYTEAFHQVYHELAAEYGTALVPFILEGIALEPGLMQADGLHPTAAAQPRIVDNVWPELEPLLQSTIAAKDQ